MFSRFWASLTRLARLIHTYTAWRRRAKQLAEKDRYIYD
jgi:hypothetical protein